VTDPFAPLEVVAALGVGVDAAGERAGDERNVGVVVQFVGVCVRVVAG